MDYRISVMLGACCAIASHAAGELLVVDSGNDRVMLFNDFDGSVLNADWLTEIGAVGWSFTTPKEAMRVGNEFWVSDQVEDAIHRFDLDRNYLTSITAHPAGGTLDNLRGFGIDGTKVYLTIMPSNAAQRGVAIYDYAGNPLAFNALNNSLFDAAPFMGDLLVSNSTTDNIERYDTSGVFQSNFAVGVEFAQQVSVLSDNSVLSVSSIAAAGIEGVYHHNSAGGLIRYIDTEPAKMAFGQLVPQGAHLLGDGNYLIAASTGVYKYDVGSDSFSQVLGGVNAQYINYAAIPAPGALPFLLLSAWAIKRRRR